MEQLPTEIHCLLAREAAYVKQYRQYQSPSDLAKAQHMRDQIDRSCWVSTSIERVK